MNGIDFTWKWSGDTVIAVCAAWGATLSTVHALLNLCRYLRSRPKIHLYAVLGANETPNEITHFLSLCVNNLRGHPVMVQSWGVDVRPGSGPVVVETTGLPKEIQAYHYIHIRNELSLFAHHQVVGMYVITHGTKKWYVPKKNLRHLLAAIDSLRKKERVSGGTGALQ